MMSFLQQALSPFIGRRSKKKRSSGVKDKCETPPTYPYYPDPVVRYRRENSPFTAVFPQEPIYDTSSCNSRSSSIRGWQTPNGFVPSRPLSPTFSKESVSNSTLSSRSSIQYRNKYNDSSVTPACASIFQADSEVTLTRSPSPPFPVLNSNTTTPCATPSPSLAPLSKIPNRKMVSPSPERCSTELGSHGDRRSVSKPPRGPSSSMRSVGVQTPVMERRMILPGGATPVLGRRGVVGVVKSGPNCRESAYSQCSFQTCSEYKPKDSTSLFRALSLTPKVRRKKNRDDELSFGRCSTATLTENGRDTPSAVSEASTLTDMPPSHASKNFESVSSCGRSSVAGKKSYDGSIVGGVSLVSNDGVENNSYNGNRVVEVRVGEAGLVRRRQRSTSSSQDVNTSVRVSVHKETWHCLPLVSKDARVPSCPREDLELRPIRESIIPEDIRLTSSVTLHKKDNVTLGIVVAGGTDKGYRPRIARLRPGSAAHRCDKLVVGDYILAVNGRPTEHLPHQEIVSLLRNSGNKVTIDIEYETPSLPGIGPEGAVVRRTTVGLLKEAGGLGITVRGGVHPSQPDKTRPLLVTHVRTAGPVDREGTIKAGDRLVAVGDHSVERSTMQEALELLQGAPDYLTLTIEYDVSVLSSVRGRGAALLVEVERPTATDLGLTLDRGRDDTIVVAAVKAASIAERCGALAVGDIITRIDGTPVGQLTPTEATQLLRSSRHPVVTLEIIPVTTAASLQGMPHPHIMGSGCSSSLGNPLSSIPYQQQLPFPHSSLHTPAPHPNMPQSSSSANHCPTYSTPYFSNFYNPPTSCYATSTCPQLSCTHHTAAWPATDTTPFRSHNGIPSVNGSPCIQTSAARCEGRNAGTGCNRLDPHANDMYVRIDCAPLDTATAGDDSVCRSFAKGSVNASQVCGCSDDSHLAKKKFNVTLCESAKGSYGLVLRPPALTTDPDLAVPVVAAIDPNSPADRCGVLCVGDRVSSVNGLSTAGLGAAEVIQLITTSSQRVTLECHFSTNECHQSSTTATGMIAVTLPVKDAPLGIGVSLSESPLTRCGASGDPADDQLGLLITSVVPGSPAHRSGAVLPGDLLVAVDSVSVSDATRAQDFISRIAQKAGHAVTLLLHRADESEEGVQYTVEVSRRGGPLGITLTGSELPSSALYVASLAPGGLAERTGAIHCGDRLLAINGHSLRGQPLSRAVHLLQAAAQVVTLRIARPRRLREKRVVSDDWVINPPSVDSAVESWGGSSGGDHHPASPPVSPSPPAKRTTAESAQIQAEEKQSLIQDGGSEPRSSSNKVEQEQQSASSKPVTACDGTPAFGVEMSNAGLTETAPSRAESSGGVETSSLTSKSTASPDFKSKSSTSRDLKSKGSSSPDHNSKNSASPNLKFKGRVSADLKLKDSISPDSELKVEDTENHGHEFEDPKCKTPVRSEYRERSPEGARGGVEGLVNTPDGHGSAVSNSNNTVKGENSTGSDYNAVSTSRSNTIRRLPKNVDPGTSGKVLNSDAANVHEGKRDNLKLGVEEDKIGAAVEDCRKASADLKAGDSTKTGVGLPPDWDEMIAALNEISASCRASARQQQQHTSGGHPPPLPDAPMPDLSSPAGGDVLLPERGVYSVSAAERGFVAGPPSGTERSDPATHRMFRVSLSKDPVYEDFGFSVSDGLYEKGVYVNRIRKGGPADRSGRVKPYDRILQVNDTFSHDFDCCLTVPLIASAGDQLHLLLSRNLNEEMTPLLRRTPDFTANARIDSHSQPKQQCCNQESSDFDAYVPLSASAKLQADRSQFLNAQLYCNSSPYLSKAEIHARSVPRQAEVVAPLNHKEALKHANLSKKPPSPTGRSGTVHQKVPSSSIAELEDQLNSLSNLNRPHLQQWADETLTLPAHFRSNSRFSQQTRHDAKAPLTPQLRRQGLGNDSRCRTNGSPVGDKVQVLYGSTPDSNSSSPAATSAANPITSCTVSFLSGCENGRSSVSLLGTGSESISYPINSALRSTGNDAFSSSLSQTEMPHLHNASSEAPVSLYVSKATVQFQVSDSPKEKSRRSGANSNKALHNSDNSTAVLKAS